MILSSLIYASFAVIFSVMAYLLLFCFISDQDIFPIAIVVYAMTTDLIDF